MSDTEKKEGRAATAWRALSEADREEALMLIHGEKIMWSPGMKNWAREAKPIARKRYQVLDLAMRVLREAAK